MHSSVPAIPLFLCTFCSPVPLCLILLCSGLFVPTLSLHLLFLCSSILCAPVPIVPLCPLFMCLLFLCSSWHPLFRRLQCSCAYCSSVPLCTHCSAVSNVHVLTVPLFLFAPTVPPSPKFMCLLFLCSSLHPLFLRLQCSCAYCSSVPLCTHCSAVSKVYVLTVPLFLFAPTVPPSPMFMCLLFLCSSLHPLFLRLQCSCAYCSCFALHPLFRRLQCSCAYCSSVPLCTHCSSISNVHELTVPLFLFAPTVPPSPMFMCLLFLCSSLHPLFRRLQCSCAYCSSIPISTVTLYLILFLSMYCSSIIPCLLLLCACVPIAPVPTLSLCLCLLFLCTHCSSVPAVLQYLLFLFLYSPLPSTAPLFLCTYCSSAPTVPLFLCAYCSSVPTVPLHLLFLCTYCSSALTVPLHLLFLCTYCSSVSTVTLFLCTFSVLYH